MNPPKCNARRITERILTRWIPTYPRRAVAYFQGKPGWNNVWVERETETQALAELLELLSDYVDTVEGLGPELAQAYVALAELQASGDGFPRGAQR